jgi:sulfinoalanine decarboxylase
MKKTPPSDTPFKQLNFAAKAPRALMAELEISLGREGMSDPEFKHLLGRLRKNRISTDSPYFMNQLFSGVRPEILEAENLIAESRTTMSTYEASGPFTLIELETVRALNSEIGWPETAEGVVVPGGSAANFMAIHCARSTASEDFRRLGNRPNWRIFSTREAHYSLEKAVLALGLGLESLVTVDVDDQGRMLPKSLFEKINEVKSEGGEPLMVIATAGTTVLGQFDPISEICDVAQGLWVHVDGAWGGPALFSSQAKSLLKGLEKASSFTFDAHKLLGSDLTCSLFLTKHEGILLEANDVHGGEYLFHEVSGGDLGGGSGGNYGDVTSREYDRGRVSWQCGRRPEIVSFWGLWKKLGTKGVGNIVDTKFELRDEVLKWINQQKGLKLLQAPPYLNICVQVLKPAQNGKFVSDKTWSRDVRNVLKRENKALVNFSVTDDGTTFLRLILAHHELRTEHVVQILSWALAVAPEG